MESELKIADLHDEVCEALLAAGGSAPEALLPAAYNGKKADAVFAEEKVIVEVKSLCKDREQTEAVTKKIDRIFDSWTHKGGPIVFGQVMIDVNKLPAAMAQEVILCFGDRIKTNLKDASRQIRDTSSALGWDSCYGIAAFVVPASFRTHPGVIGHAAWDLLRRPDQAPAVNEVVIIAVPVRDHPANGSVGQLIFSDHPRGDDRLPEGFVSRICDHFARRFEQSYNIPKMKRIDGSEELFMSRFMGRKVG
jgi:hypothetical protein